VNLSVLASGKILLNDGEISVSELEQALDDAQRSGTRIRYTRENPQEPASQEAAAVIQMIIDRGLSVEFAGISNVIAMPGIEALFVKVRKKAAESRGVSLVRPDRTHFILPGPPDGSIKAPMVEGVKAVIPSEAPRFVAAMVAQGALAGDPSQKPSLPEVARRVPFMGLLVGLAYTGHAVWMFEASAEWASAGSEEADVLIVDSEAIASLAPSWLEDAARVMRNGNVLVYDRSRQKIGSVRTAGEIPGKIEFVD
jgi:hypothetical protein